MKAAATVIALLAAIAGCSAGVDQSGISPAITAGCEDRVGRPPMVSATAMPAVPPGVPVQLVVNGRDYFRVGKSDQAIVAERGCAVAVATRSPDERSLTLAYALPAGLIPATAQISRLDTAICGAVEGDFWEVYGPSGSDPFEIEVQQPGSDGCWHFSKAMAGDGQLVFYISGDTTMRIERVLYTVTFS